MNQREDDRSDDQMQKIGRTSFDVGDVIRIPMTAGNYRAWQIVGINLGGEYQEDTYAMRAIDLMDSDNPIHVPRFMLETHEQVRKL